VELLETLRLDLVTVSVGIAAPWLRTWRPVIPCLESQKTKVAMMLDSPINDERMPDAMTMRHIGKPKLLTLVACLFRLPRILKPRMIIAMPRKTKPDSGLRSGQEWAK